MPLLKKSRLADQMVLWELDNIYPFDDVSHRHRTQNVQQPMPPRGISLCTGAGGMDVGFSRAGIQVKIIAPKGVKL